MSRSLLVLVSAVLGCGSDKGVTIHNSAPAAAILAPVGGTLFESDETIRFEGVVEDAQTSAELLDVTWATDRSGIIAEDVVPDVDGMVFFATTGLTPGAHVVTLQVIDEGGKRASDTVSIEVINDDDPPVIESIEHPSGDTSDTAQEGVPYEFETIVSDPQDEAFDLIVTISLEGIAEDGSTELVELCNAVPESSGLASCEGTMDKGVQIVQFEVMDTDGNTTTARAEIDVVPTNATDDDGDGFSEDDGDCDDTDEDIHPGAFELLNGADDDCDGIIDNNTNAYDDDGDTYSEDEGDCNDDDASVHPSATEVCDGIDNDCDGEVDGEGTPGAEEFFLDFDGDGFGTPDESEWACEAPGRHVDNSADCNDEDAAIHPDATEICDGLDNNCDGLTDGADATGAVTTYRDLDDDGFGDALTSNTQCDPPEGYVADDTDCDDTDSAVSPSGTEICDGADNDCDTEYDEEGAEGCTWYFLDADADGYGTTDTSCTCSPTGDYTSSIHGDCYDSRADVNPTHTAFHTSDRGDGSFDYNCDTSEEKELTSVIDACDWTTDLSCSSPNGWDGSPPTCGSNGTWKTNCSYDFDWFSSGCYWDSSTTVTQACR
jgi:hypothetical protein